MTDNPSGYLDKRKDLSAMLIDDKSIGQCLNNYFANITDTLNIPRPVDIMPNEQSGDPIIVAVEKYKTHPSIVMIKEKTRGQTFEFSHIDPSLVLHEINKIRERSFLILGTGAEDFSQGYETFLHYFAGVRKF